jgi:hypothetical protein
MMGWFWSAHCSRNRGRRGANYCTTFGSKSGQNSVEGTPFNKAHAALYAEDWSSKKYGMAEAWIKKHGGENPDLIVNTQVADLHLPKTTVEGLQALLKPIEIEK